ncbi:10 TM acyl transferase domain found in Cas1p-domain-containing protein [Mycotypha africana]|uniref:10 TM acyl transferase domain found in Cas1p-domain-containing protein n=1 Tax=Mycotypha africana TaxID=64632 RepID=UPI00230097C2|nr:10 TM acyl transferase domain found in Cas1p-domain-containing protein [Mycotypha africana]KAI8967068.1 10 TM acyl transferase domain found in Cas1p-domain-containing protein [Mycotypha africana]
MLHPYKPTDISTCLSKGSRRRRVVYIGDSIVRQQYFALLQLIRPNVSLEGDAHTNRKYIFQEEQLELEFWWDPYLNDTFLQFLTKSSVQQPKSSLMVVGGGAWHMRYLPPEDYFSAWRQPIDVLFQTVRQQGMTEAMMVLPVEIPDYSRLDANRSTSITIDKVHRMNEYLHTQLLNLEKTTQSLPLQIPFVWNTMSTTQFSNHVTQDGLHFNTFITHAQTQVVLNYRCNDQLEKKFPMASTCCYHYPRPTWYQIGVILYYLAWIPVGFLFLSATVASIQNNSGADRRARGLATRLFPSQKILQASFTFGLCIIYMYYSDRTHLFGKINKHFDTTAFASLMLATAVLGMVQLRHSSTPDKDEGFLNRHQTDEWKGWMQIIILIYHALSASSVSGIYNAVRILVAAYLFQTGYGHFTFFYKKQDFSLKRVLNVMVRLNYLTCVLSYIMDTNYLSYYFTPLVSFWFLVIWGLMYVGHAWNQKTWFVLTKLLVGGIVTTCFIHWPGVMEGTFDLLKLIFHVDWDAAEWRFRLGLDAYIVYVGMLCALGYLKWSSSRAPRRWPLLQAATLAVSVLALVWYFWYEITRDNKFVYNAMHPYISWIPILAFVFLRNATLSLRNTHSAFFAFIGRISLETFIGQFHMWLAGDTKGLLVLVPPRWLATDATFLTRHDGWWINFMLSSAVFVYLSYHLHQATQILASWICQWLTMSAAPSSPSSSSATTHHGREYEAVPLLPTHATWTQVDSANDTMDNNNNNNDSTHPQAHIFKRCCQWNSLNRLMHDTRFKVVFFFIFIAFFNHLC